MSLKVYIADPEAGLYPAFFKPLSEFTGGGGVASVVAGAGIAVNSANPAYPIISATGGGGTPGGSATQLQYNNAGAFGGLPLTWDGTRLFTFLGNIAATPQVRFDLVGNDTYMNVPFRVNAITDVPCNFVTNNLSTSQIALSMDVNAMGSNKTGDPAYSAYFGWRGIASIVIWGDRKTSGHDNGNATLYLGYDPGSGYSSNKVSVAGQYLLPIVDGASGQVLTTNGAGVASWAAGGGGGGGAPGGAADSVQYNNAGAFGGFAAITMGTPSSMGIPAFTINDGGILWQTGGSNKFATFYAGGGLYTYDFTGGDGFRFMPGGNYVAPAFADFENTGSKGPVVVDRSTGARRRIKVTAGVVSSEAA